MPANRTRMLLTCILVTVGTAVALGDEASDYERFRKRAQAEKRQRIQMLLAERSPAIATLKFVRKRVLLGRESKSEAEAPAAIVSPDGLVLVANSALEGGLGRVTVSISADLSDLLGDTTTKVETEDHKLIVGVETREYEAKLIARDSDLDLAWFRLADIADRKLPAIDFKQAEELAVGDSYYTISRLSESFDRAPVVTSHTVGGRVEVPRPLLVGTGGSGVVFTTDNTVAGFLIEQWPGEEADDLDDISFNAFILSPAQVVTAMQKAQAMADREDRSE